MKGRTKRAFGVALLLVFCLASYTYSAYFYVKPHPAKLSWKPSVSMVKGYNVYRGTHPGGPYTRINSEVHRETSYVDSTVEPGMTYYYVTTAISPWGVESGYSNEVVALIPRDKR